MNPSATKIQANNVFARRLKEARLARGLSQKQLGIACELDVGVASTRINRYETGVHSPDYLTATRIAQALRIALSSLYTDDDSLSRMINAYAAADAETRIAVERLLAPFAGED